MQTAPGWSEDSMHVITLHSSVFFLFRPEANKSVLKANERTRFRESFLANLECFTLVKRIKLIKTRLLAT